MKEIIFKSVADVAVKFSRHTTVGKITKIAKALTLAGAMSTAAANPTAAFAQSNYDSAYSIDTPAAQMQEYSATTELTSIDTLNVLAPVAPAVHDYVTSHWEDSNIFDQAAFVSRHQMDLADKPTSGAEGTLPLYHLPSSSTSNTKLLQTIEYLYENIGENEYSTNIENPFSTQPIGIVTKSDVAAGGVAFPDYSHSITQASTGKPPKDAVKGGIIYLGDGSFTGNSVLGELMSIEEDGQLFSALQSMALLSDHTKSLRTLHKLDHAPGSDAPRASKFMSESELFQHEHNVNTSLTSQADTTALLTMIKLLDMSKSDAIQLTKDVLLLRAIESNNLSVTYPGINDKAVLIDLIDNHFSDIKDMELYSIPALSHFINEFSSTHPVPNRVRAILDESGIIAADRKSFISSGIDSKYGREYLEVEYSNQPDALDLTVDSIPENESISESLNQAMFGMPRYDVLMELDKNKDLDSYYHLDNTPTAEP